MNHDPMANERFEAAFEDHQSLMQHFNLLQQFWSEVNQLGEGPKFEELASRIGELRDELVIHFEHEERGGYLAPALEVAPRFTSQAEALQQQHQQFLDDLNALIFRLRDCDPSLQGWEHAWEEFKTFVGQLHQHEQAENAIVQTALGEDIGAGD